MSVSPVSAPNGASIHRLGLNSFWTDLVGPEVLLFSLVLFMVIASFSCIESSRHVYMIIQKL